MFSAAVSGCCCCCCCCSSFCEQITASLLWSPDPAWPLPSTEWRQSQLGPDLTAEISQSRLILDPGISSHLVTAASPRCRLSLLLSSRAVGEVCPTIEYLSHLSSFNKHTYSALESFGTTHCQFIKPCRYSTFLAAWRPVQALHRASVCGHFSISPLLHPPRKYLLTFYTAAAVHLHRCRHRV